MTREPFSARQLDTDRITDPGGRDVGRIVATEAGTDQDTARVILDLADDVREERRVTQKRFTVPVDAVKLDDDGHPRLAWSIDELLERADASHADPREITKNAPDRPPHFGAPADPDKAHD